MRLLESDTIRLLRNNGRYSAVHGFWPVKFSSGRLGASHYRSAMFGFVSSLRLRKYSWPCHTEVPSI